MAFLLGLAYFGWLVFGMARPGEGQVDTERIRAFADIGLPLFAAVLTAAWWLGSRSHMVLAFAPAEVHFLFAGPVARRTLLDYKLLSAQVKLLPLALMFTLVLHGLLPLPWPLTALSLWAMMETAHLHQVAAGLVRASWTHHGRAGLQRQWVPLVLLVGGGVVLVTAMLPLLRGLGHMASFDAFFRELERALSRPGPALVLLPFRIVIAPLLAADTRDWSVGLAGTLGVGVLHYLWVMRIDAAFEETAAKAGSELQSLVSAVREGRGFAAIRAQRGGRVRAPWFRLRPSGHPAVAVFWKSFTAFTRNLSPGGVVTLVLVFGGFRVLLGFIADSPHEAAMIAAGVPAIMAGMAITVGPLFLRNDLRTDFQRQEVMRTFPLSGRDVVAAEVAASGASLTVVVGFFLTLAAVFLFMAHPQLPRPWILPAAWLGALVVAAPVCFLALGVQNLLAVAYPAWARFGPTQQQGMDQMGTMILMMLVTVLLLAIGLLVPVIAGGAIALRLVFFFGVWTVIPAAVVAWLALVGECAVLIVLLGETYDDMDPSELELLG